ncbi:MAG: head GIN domain-containing protein [Thermaurantimonas sp.]
MFLVVFQSCSLRSVDASGIHSEKSAALPAFTHLTLSGNFTFILKPADNSSILLKGDSTFLDHMSFSVDKKKLVIESRRDWKGADPPVVEVYTNEPIRQLELAGLVKAVSQRRMEADKFQLDMAGAARADLNIRANELMVNQSGASQLKISGAVETFLLNSAGASYTDARNLPSRNLKTNLSGASKAEVFAIDRLNVTLSGASSLKYAGSPAIKSKISGNGTLSVIQ